MGAKGEQDRDHADSHSLFVKNNNKVAARVPGSKYCPPKEDKTPGIAAPLGGAHQDPQILRSRKGLLNISREMAWSTAWCSALPLWLLWGAACSSAASGDDNAFPFDIEGSSVVGRQDPPETSDPRVTLGRLPSAAEVRCPPLFSPPCSAPVLAGWATVFFLSPSLFDNLEFHLD